MNRKINDDFFEGTSMSFGDHLEELRNCLFKAVIWLILGVCVGLFFGNRVVKFIERPVQDALVRYYQNKSIAQIEANLGYELDEPEKEALLKELRDNNWIAVDLWIEPSEIRRLAASSANPAAADPEAPEPQPAENVAAPEVQERPADQQPLTDDEVAAALRKAEILPQEKPVRMRTWQQISPSTEALRVEEVFMIWMKAGIVTGAVIASPFIFFHIWQFIAAGLYPHERKYVWVFLPFSLTLFFGGAAIAYFMAFAPVLDFLFSFNLMTGIDPTPRISEWMGFVIMLPLGFGISFQLPLVMLLLNRIGVFSLEAYTGQWRVAILVIFVISMVLTPADPISMLLLAVPLTFLYFMGIALCQWMPSTRAPFPTT